MEWRSTRDGVRLFVIANVAFAITTTIAAVLGAIDRKPTTTTGSLAIPVAIVASAFALVEVVAAFAIARLPRGTRGRGAAIAWAIATAARYALWLAAPYAAALAPVMRSAPAIASTVVWIGEASLFLVVALAVTRSAGALFVLSVVAIAVRAATLAVGWFVDMPQLWRTLAPVVANLFVIATQVAWARRIAAVIPPRDADELAVAEKSRDVARHTLALFRRGFAARIVVTWVVGLAIVLAASLGAHRVTGVLAIVFTLATLVASAIVMIALGGWAVVGGGFAKLAGWLAALDFAVALAWIAIAIFGIELGELFGLLARAATAIVGAAVPLAFAISLARLARSDALARDARRAVWAIAGFALAIGATIALIVAPIRPGVQLQGVLYGIALQTLPSIVVGASVLVALFMLWLVRAAELGAAARR